MAVQPYTPQCFLMVNHELNFRGRSAGLSDRCVLFHVKLDTLDVALPAPPARSCPCFSQWADTIGMNDRTLDTPIIDAPCVERICVAAQLIKRFAYQEPSTALADP